MKRNLASQWLYNGGWLPTDFTVGEGGKLIPSADHEILMTMRTMRAAGSGIRRIARAVGKQPTTVKRILERSAA